MRIGLSGGSLSHCSVEAIAAFSEKLGATSFEITWKQNFHSLDDVRKAHHILGERRVQADVVNSFLFRSMEEVDRLDETLVDFETCLDAAGILGSKYILIYCPCRPRDLISEADYISETDRFSSSLKRCADLCEARGLKLVIENHADWLLRSVDETVRLLDREARLGMAFDPANFYSSGEEAFPRAYRLLRDRIDVVHVKDPMRFDERIHPGQQRTVERTVNGKLIKGLFADLGEGAINWEGMMKDLRNTGFSGPLIIEPYTSFDKLDNSFEKAAEYLRSRI